jgi:hypothetical protein
MSFLIIINLTYPVLKNFLPRKPTPSLARNEKSGLLALRQKSAIEIRHLGYQRVRYHGETFFSCYSNHGTDLTGDPSETSNGSHLPIHATYAPSAPELCSGSANDGLFDRLPNTSSPKEGSLESPENCEIRGLSEEYPSSKSTPTESPLSNGTTGPNDDRMDADNSDIYPQISKPSSLQSILSQSPFPFSQSPLPADIISSPPIESLCDWGTGDVSLLQQPWNIALPADINPSPPIESLCDWETGDVSLLHEPWNSALPADIGPSPPIESLCDWVTGDVSLPQQPWNTAQPADINPSPPIHLGQGAGTSMLDQILETLILPSGQSCPAQRENTSFRDPETSSQGPPLSHTIYRNVSNPSVSTVAAI